MAELSVDQTRDAYMKAQAEVKRAADDLAVKQSEVIRAQAEMATAKTSEQINATTRSLAALDTQARDTDPANDPALRRLANERATAETKLLALQGCKQREQAQLGKAETDVVKAEHALAQAKTLLQKAKDDATSAMYDAEEARLIAAKEPLPQHLAERAAYRERMEEREREREIRSCRDAAYRRYLANIGERCPSIEEKMRMEDELFNLVWAERHGEKPPKTAPSLVQTESRQPLKSGEQGWGQHLHSFDSRGPPVPVRTVRGGAEETWDPFAED